MPKKPVKTKEGAEHIRDLQRRAKELVGDELSFFESENLIPPCLARQYRLIH